VVAIPEIIMIADMVHLILTGIMTITDMDHPIPTGIMMITDMAHPIPTGIMTLTGIVITEIAVTTLVVTTETPIQIQLMKAVIPIMVTGKMSRLMAGVTMIMITVTALLTAIVLGVVLKDVILPMEIVTTTMTIVAQALMPATIEEAALTTGNN
jgi:hypothetical protein